MAPAVFAQICRAERSGSPLHGLRLGKVQIKSTKKRLISGEGFPGCKERFRTFVFGWAESGIAEEGNNCDGREELWLKGPGLSTLRTETVLPDSGQN